MPEAGVAETRARIDNIMEKYREACTKAEGNATFEGRKIEENTDPDRLDRLEARAERYQKRKADWLDVLNKAGHEPDYPNKSSHKGGHPPPMSP